MAAALPDLSKFVASVATGLPLFLTPLLGFLERAPARSPALDAAVTASIIGIAVVYFVGAVLVYLYILSVQAAAEPSPPPAPWRFVVLGVTLVCLLLVFIEGPLVIFLLYAADGRKRVWQHCLDARD